MCQYGHMMIVPTIPSKIYEVQATQTCEILTDDGLLIGVADRDNRVSFVASRASVVLSDDSAVLTAVSRPPFHRLHIEKKGTVSSPTSLSKYEHCTSVADVVSVQAEYVADIDSGVWMYSLKSLEDGNGMFASVVSLRDFLAALPSLQSGKNMFSGCILSLCSVKNIARTVPMVEEGVLTLGIDIRQKNSTELAAALQLLESKGWVLEVQFNTPNSVLTLAELEYLEHPSTTDRFVLAYIQLPLPDVTSPQDSLAYETEHFFEQPTTTKESEGVPINYGSFGCGYVKERGTYMWIDGTLNTASGNPLHDWVEPYTTSPHIWEKIHYYVGNSLNPYWQITVNDVVQLNKNISWGAANKPRKVFYIFGYPSQSGENADYTQRVLRGKKRFAKIWVNGQLLYDLIPVLDETGEACLFDKVSQQYFYNAGEGKFGWMRKSAVMRLRSTVSTELVLPRSPIWARVREKQMEWCHYTSKTDGWQQFASIAEAREALGIDSPM